VHGVVLQSEEVVTVQPLTVIVPALTVPGPPDVLLELETDPLPAWMLTDVFPAEELLDSPEACKC
jgi:hypothetical protein